MLALQTRLECHPSCMIHRAGIHGVAGPAAVDARLAIEARPDEHERLVTGRRTGWLLVKSPGPTLVHWSTVTCRIMFCTVWHSGAVRRQGMGRCFQPSPGSRSDRPAVDLTHEQAKRRLILGGLITEYERAA
jgi:hypothetical protein